MTTDVRRTALRAAAKCAIIVTLGCGGRTAPAQPEPDVPPVAEPSCAEYLASLETVDQVPEGDPLHGQLDVYGAFADVEARSSARTRECCTEQLVAGGSGAAQRWECCSALGDVPEGAEPSACTPWGPPCPPEMPA